LWVLHNICNMVTHDLPDMYAHSPPALGITYQANHSCPCYNYKLNTCDSTQASQHFWYQDTCLKKMCWGTLLCILMEAILVFKLKVHQYDNSDNQYKIILPGYISFSLNFNYCNNYVQLKKKPRRQTVNIKHNFCIQSGCST